MKPTCRHPGKIARDAMAFLRSIGATAVVLLQNRRCLSLCWCFAGRAFSTPCSRAAHGGNALQTVQRLVRHQLRDAGLAPGRA